MSSNNSMHKIIYKHHSQDTCFEDLHPILRNTAAESSTDALALSISPFKKKPNYSFLFSNSNYKNKSKTFIDHGFRSRSPERAIFRDISMVLSDHFLEYKGSAVKSKHMVVVTRYMVFLRTLLAKSGKFIKNNKVYERKVPEDLYDPVRYSKVIADSVAMIVRDYRNPKKLEKSKHALFKEINVNDHFQNLINSVIRKVEYITARNVALNEDYVFNMIHTEMSNAMMGEHDREVNLGILKKSEEDFINLQSKESFYPNIDKSVGQSTGPIYVRLRNTGGSIGYDPHHQATSSFKNSSVTKSNDNVGSNSVTDLPQLGNNLTNNVIFMNIPEKNESEELTMEQHSDVIKQESVKSLSNHSTKQVSNIVIINQKPSSEKNSGGASSKAIKAIDSDNKLASSPLLDEDALKKDINDEVISLRDTVKSNLKSSHGDNRTPSSSSKTNIVFKVTGDVAVLKDDGGIPLQSSQTNFQNYNKKLSSSNLVETIEMDNSYPIEKNIKDKYHSYKTSLDKTSANTTVQRSLDIDKKELNSKELINLIIGDLFKVGANRIDLSMYLREYSVANLLKNKSIEAIFDEFIRTVGISGNSRQVTEEHKKLIKKQLRSLAQVNEKISKERAVVPQFDSSAYGSDPYVDPLPVDKKSSNKNVILKKSTFYEKNKITEEGGEWSPRLTAKESEEIFSGRSGNKELGGDSARIIKKNRVINIDKRIKSKVASDNETKTIKAEGKISKVNSDIDEKKGKVSSDVESKRKVKAISDSEGGKKVTTNVIGTIKKINNSKIKIVSKGNSKVTSRKASIMSKNKGETNDNTTNNEVADEEQHENNDIVEERINMEDGTIQQTIPEVESGTFAPSLRKSSLRVSKKDSRRGTVDIFSSNSLLSKIGYQDSGSSPTNNKFNSRHSVIFGKIGSNDKISTSTLNRAVTQKMSSKKINSSNSRIKSFDNTKSYESDSDSYSSEGNDRVGTKIYKYENSGINRKMSIIPKASLKRRRPTDFKDQIAEELLGKEGLNHSGEGVSTKKKPKRDSILGLDMEFLKRLNDKDYGKTDAYDPIKDIQARNEEIDRENSRILEEQNEKTLQRLLEKGFILKEPPVKKQDSSILGGFKRKKKLTRDFLRKDDEAEKERAAKELKAKMQNVAKLESITQEDKKLEDTLKESNHID
jgi:hypothetical protein